MPAKLSSGCAGCIPWDSPATGPDACCPCATQPGSSHSALAKVNSHSTAWNSTAWNSTARPGVASKAKQHWCCWWLVGLEEGTDLATVTPCWLQITPCRLWGDIPGGNYPPGELALPLQRAAPMAKAEVCLNPARFLLKSSICTYICIIYVYI